MAYGKEITRTCLISSCPKRAVTEVFNFRNASLGEFCRSHGGRKLAEQRTSEAALTKAEAEAQD